MSAVRAWVEMVRLTDAVLLGQFEEALQEWNCSGFVKWKVPANEWMRKNLEGCTPKLVAKLMYEHLQQGGEIDQVRERRPEFADVYAFHYDFRFEIDGRRIYVETVLDSTSTGPIVTVVSIHDA